jgi:hypothetical protein
MKNKSKLFSWGFLVIIILFGLLLRLWKWPAYLNFDFEKARDLVDSLNIFLNKKLTLIGPTTEVEGIFHGPLYYYLTGFFYFITGGDPRAGSIVSFGFNLFGIWVIYYIAKEIFNRRIGLVAAFLYALSFESVSYAYWLSNPGPAVPFIFLMFFFFYKFLTEKQGRYLVLSLFCLGLTIQFQVLNVIFLPALIVLYLLSSKPKVDFKWTIYSLVSFLLPIFSYLLFDLRHNFLMSRNFLTKMLLPQLGGGGHFWLTLKNYPLRLFGYFSTVLLPTQKWTGILLALLILWTTIFRIRKKSDFLWKFLLVWLFSTLPIFFLPSRMGESNAAFIGVAGTVVIVFAYFVNWLWSKSKILVGLFLALILASNLYAVNNYLTNPQKRLFDNFEGLFLKIDLALVDYSYHEANGENFKVDTVTSPLLISKLWDYLYEWRGKTKFHSLPIRGDEAKIKFLIIEPFVDESWKKDAIIKADQKGRLVDSRYFGQIFIQKRILK